MACSVLRRTLLGALLALVLVSYPFLALEAQVSPADIPDTDFGKFLPALGYNFTRGLFSAENLFPLFIGGFGASVVHPFDEDISEEISPYSDVVGETGQILGSPAVIAVSAASLIAAPFSEDPRFRAFAFDLSQAYIVNFAVVQATKYAVGRTRPNGEEDTSFPSGHSADSFLLATLLNHYYGKKFGIPAYALASFVAFSRVQKGKHFPSDVVFGGALGYVIARAAVRGHTVRSQERISWLPYAGRDSIGVIATVYF